MEAGRVSSHQIQSMLSSKAKGPRELSHRLTAGCLVSGTCDGDHI